MPKVYLDDVELKFEDTENNSTIGELVRLLEGEMALHKRFVHQLWIEGKRMDMWREEKILEQPISAYEELRFVSADYNVLFAEAIYVIKEYIATVKENIDEISRKIRVGDISIDEYLAAIFTHINEIVRTISAIKRSKVFHHTELFREDPEKYYPELLKIMEELKDIFEQKDIVLLADTFEYELLPFLDRMGSSIFHPADSEELPIKPS